VVNVQFKHIFDNFLRKSLIFWFPKCQELVHVVQSKFISRKRKSLRGRVGIKCAFLVPIARKCWKLEVNEIMAMKFTAKHATEGILDPKDTDTVVALVL